MFFFHLTSTRGARGTSLRAIDVHPRSPGCRGAKSWPSRAHVSIPGSREWRKEENIQIVETFGRWHNHLKKRCWGGREVLRDGKRRIEEEQRIRSTFLPIIWKDPMRKCKEGQWTPQCLELPSYCGLLWTPVGFFHVASIIRRTISEKRRSRMINATHAKIDIQTFKVMKGESLTVGKLLTVQKVQFLDHQFCHPLTNKFVFF